MSIYVPTIASTTETVAVRGVNYQVRRWGRQDLQVPPPLVLLHGWMDVSASYQFVVDALGPAVAQSRAILAPDWRGFGGSMPRHALDHYLFADYYADLDALLRHYLGAHGQVDLVGHSMGGNIAMVYAGLRPERVRRLVNLEGFGLPDGNAEEAPVKLRRWLDDVHALEQGQLQLRPYVDLDAVAARLMKTNPRLAPDKARWLAPHWAEQQPDGRWRNRGDAAHKVASCSIYRAAEILAIHRCIAAPVLAVEASDDSIGAWSQGRYSLAEYHQRLQQVPNHRVARVADAGHMLHHDQPQAVAELIRDFLR